MIENWEICGGMIKISVDTFCAKGKCANTSHSRKHTLFGPNRMFLVSSSGSATSTTRKVMEPEKFYLEVADPRDLRVLKMIQVGVAELKGITNLDNSGGISLVLVTLLVFKMWPLRILHLLVLQRLRRRGQGDSQIEMTRYR